MSITADVIRRLSALKLAPDAMFEVLSILADVQSNHDSALDDSRTAGAKRQARYRERKTSNDVTCNVTDRNENVTALRNESDASVTLTVTNRNESDVPREREIEIPSLDSKEVRKREKPILSGLSKKMPRRTSISEDEQSTAKDELFASNAGINFARIQTEWAQFRDHHRKTGAVMADWGAAWRTWVRNAKKYEARAGPAGRSNGTQGFVESVLLDIENDKRSRAESSLEIVPMLQFGGDRD